MKKFFLILVFVYLISSLSSLTIQADVPSAKASIVMDVNTGRVLYSYNSDVKLPMASTTKIMTVLLAIEKGKIDDIVNVSRRAATEEGSSIYLKEGEQIKLEDLLYGIMLRSGNDAAVAVAEHLCGSVENFVELMNKKAKSIGVNNTNFSNPHGLPDDNHYTTAYDLALITCYALKNESFRKIVKTQRKSISGPPGVSWNRAFLNKNKMLWQYDGGDGVKTGYTKKAGRCLVSSATKNGWQLVSVVLNCSDWWNYSSKLLDYGFENYDNVKIVDKESTLIKMNVKKGKEKDVNLFPSCDLYAPLSKTGENDEKVTYIKCLPDYAKAPIKKNEKAGVLQVYIGNCLVGQVDLMYSTDIESSDILYNIQNILKSLLF